jgi:hypothetical protein
VITQNGTSSLTKLFSGQTLRSRGHIVLAVASSGVASLLLPGGRTAHSRFRIPLDLHEESRCAIARGTNLAELLCRASLIIWDEAPMAHRHCFDDRTLRDILSVDDVRNSDIPFGGKPILLGGDFRQVLPVVKGADRSEIIGASLLSSHLWTHFTVNMRLVSPDTPDQIRSSVATFARLVLDVGEGNINCPFTPGDTNRLGIQVPERYLINSKESKIIAIMKEIYNDFENQYSSMPYLAGRSVVCPTNSVVDDVNSFMITKVPGAVREYLSSDGIANGIEQPSDFELLYPPEFLNSISINNFPQHRLLLKPGVPVVLLRNINQSIGLCNGTRLLVQRLGDRVIEACIMTGYNVSLSVAIPIIVLNSNCAKWPFVLQRRQFRVKVCYAMTINKCQGQTLHRVGVYLKEPAFTHGQLYVAVSRVNKEDDLRIIIEDDTTESSSITKNIVYNEVLQFVSLIWKNRHVCTW